MNLNPFKKAGKAAPKAFTAQFKRDVAVGRMLLRTTLNTGVLYVSQIGEVSCKLSAIGWDELLANGAEVTSPNGGKHSLAIGGQEFEFESFAHAVAAYELVTDELQSKKSAGLPTWAWVAIIAFVGLLLFGGGSKGTKGETDPPQMFSGAPPGMQGAVPMNFLQLPSAANEKPSLLSLLDEKVTGVSPKTGAGGVNNMLDTTSPLLAKCPAPGGK